jgi:arylsulfatase A-like enzyme
MVTSPPIAPPANAVVVLLDSLNRHLLGAYGGTEFATPNLDRFAAQSVRFTNHFTGSLPCMPARHDILCGQLDFLWKPWGSVELWEDTVVYELHRSGVTTMLVSDHPHLFETGGENYHVDFMGWEYERGQGGDTWKTRPDPSWMGAPVFGFFPVEEYHRSRGWFGGEDGFPGPRTMARAAQWIDENAGWHDRFLLFVDEFDPHEPFDTPDAYASLYDPDWEGPHLVHPPYMVGAIDRGDMTERQGRQVRACYGAKLTMIDHWFGRVLEALDRNGLADTTAVVVCTDHGHYLGDRRLVGHDGAATDIWGKPGVPVFEPMGHIPLMVRVPGVAASDCDALTTSVDLCATIADLFDVVLRQRTSGRSLLPLIRGETTSIRDWALTGVWGREVHLVDRRATYARGPVGENAPLSMWSNRWSTMPTRALSRRDELPMPDDRAVLARMPGSDIPVIRQPFVVGDRLPYWAATRFTGNHLYDRADDPDEEHNLAGSRREAEMAELLRVALLEMEAPPDQLVRLGLA